MITLTLTTADLPGTAAENGEMSPRSDRPKRRSFTAQYKADILAEYDAADPAGRGVVLRREGLYSSHIAEWRKTRDSAALAGLTASPRPSKTSAEQRELAKMTARAERAERELARTKAALDIVGKAHALLEMLSESAAIETRSKP